MSKITRMYNQMQRNKIKKPSFTRRIINPLYDYFDEYILDPIDDVKSFFRNIKIGLSNIIKYMSIIYNDRDWDHFYLMKIMNYKLERMYKELKDQQFAVINKKHLKSLKICSVLSNRIMEDNYDIDDKEFEKKWGKIEFTNNTIKRSKVLSKKEEKQYNFEFREMIDRSEQRRKDDIELLFKLMNKHLRSWWW